MDRLYKSLPWVLTLFFAAFCLVKFFVEGPHWLHQNGDVNYTYLLSGLDYLGLHASGINDQPAITTKLWNAMVIGIVYLNRFLFIENKSIEYDVIQHSEFYLHVISIALFIGVLWALYAFLKYSQSVMTNKTVWILAALSFFFSSVIFHSVFVNKPEPMLIILGLWLGKIVVQSCLDTVQPKVFEILLFILLVLLTKVTFFPFLLLLFFLFERKMMWTRVIPFALLGSILLLVVWNKEIIETSLWVLDALLSTGPQGSGEAGMYNASTLNSHVVKLLKTNVLLLITLLLGTLFLIKSKKHIKARIGFLVCFGLFFFIIVKEPSSHYFVPCYALLPSFVLISFAQYKLDPFKYAIWMCAVFMVLRGTTYARDIQTKQTHWKNYEREKGVEMYFSSSKAYTLFYANKKQNFRHSELLYQLYPTDTFYAFNHHFYTFQHRIDYAQILHQEFTVVGTSDFIEKSSWLKILDKKVVGLKHTYRVKVIQIPNYR